MNHDQFQDWPAAIGLGGTLRMYDDALHTEFEDQFNDRLQKLTEVANEELDDKDLSMLSYTAASLGSARLTD